METMFSFADELEKIAVSREWIERKTRSGTEKRLNAAGTALDRGDTKGAAEHLDRVNRFKSRVDRKAHGQMLKGVDRYDTAVKLDRALGDRAGNIYRTLGDKSVMRATKYDHAFTHAITAKDTKGRTAWDLGSEFKRRTDPHHRGNPSSGSSKAPMSSHAPSASTASHSTSAAKRTKGGGKMLAKGLGAAALVGGGLLAADAVSQHLRNKKKGKAKHASHSMELAGLGILAAPHAYNAATGKHMNRKTERNMELAGLGTLALPSLGHYGAKLLKRASVEEEKVAADLWNPTTGNVSELSSKANRAAGTVSSTAAAAAPKAKMPSGQSMLDMIRKSKANYGKGISTVIKAVK